MIAILVIVFITLMAAAFTVFGSRHALPGDSHKTALPPPGARGLFSGPAPEDYAADGTNEKSSDASKQRAGLLERARQGDLAALSEAHATGDAGLYGETLDALVEQASGRHEAMSALVTHIAKSNELRANTGLAEKALANWKTAPDRRSTIDALHIAALSDDAAVYQKAVEEALRLWQGGRLAAVSAEELLALVESQYWVLASEARLGGAGYALKRMLADVRRKLAAATPAR